MFRRGKLCTICLPASFWLFLLTLSCSLIDQPQAGLAANPAEQKQIARLKQAPGQKQPFNYAFPQKPQTIPGTMPGYVEFSFPAEAVLAEITYPQTFADRTGVQRTGYLRVLARGKFRVPKQAGLLLDLKPEALTNMALIQKLSACRVTKIDANKLDFDDSHTVFLKDFKDLKELDLCDTLVTDKSLATIGSLKSLECLVLSHTGINGDGFKYLSGLKNLKLLHISTIKLRKGALAQLKPLAPHIIRLNIGHVELSNDDLSVVQYLKKVQILDISSNPKVDNHATAYLSQLGDMRRLNIEDTGINDTSLRVLIKLPKLETVYVFQKTFWSKGAKTAKTGHIKILDAASISDDTLEALTPLH
jgi:hypothetical protein